MEQFEGFSLLGHVTEVYKLVKLLYHLRQAPNEELSSLILYNHLQSTTDCLLLTPSLIFI